MLGIEAIDCFYSQAHVLRSFSLGESSEAKFSACSAATDAGKTTCG